MLVRSPENHRSRLRQAARAVRLGNTAVLLLLGALLVFFPSGCGGGGRECTDGQSRCNDNRAESCEYQDHGGGYYWSGSSCDEGTCQLSRDDQWPYCTVGNAPDARCSDELSTSGQASRSSFCEGNVAMSCHDGFLVGSLDCSVDNGRLPSEPGFCVKSTLGAWCAPTAEPSSLCEKATGADERICNGHELLSCRDGYLLDRFECPAPGTCAFDGVAFCTRAPAEDPDCPPNWLIGSFCRDNAYHECRAGWITSEHSCEPGTTCQPLGDHTVACL